MPKLGNTLPSRGKRNGAAEESAGEWVACFRLYEFLRSSLINLYEGHGVIEAGVRWGKSRFLPM